MEECILAGGPLKGKKFVLDVAVEFLIVPETKRQAQWFEPGQEIALKDVILSHIYERTITMNGLHFYLHKGTEREVTTHNPLDNI